MERKLLLATNNPGKVREYRALLQGLPWRLTTPGEEGVAEEPEETGTTFEENALLKARYYAARTGLPTLADDSGLEVDALAGEPGVRSARYAGAEATDEERLRFLLAKLAGVPWERRTARFRCVIALVWPSGREETFQGALEGYVAEGPQGKNGFGYDPVMYLPRWRSTVAQLDLSTKNLVSHRGQAARQVAERLRREPEVVGERA
ncbi:MAG: XTP/dITP diphosphatase [Chloroflexi bacterium]|nr:XTP/dITP diphosphatase [Chloroflexota bacterium]